MNIVITQKQHTRILKLIQKVIDPVLSLFLYLHHYIHNEVFSLLNLVLQGQIASELREDRITFYLPLQKHAS